MNTWSFEFCTWSLNRFPDRGAKVSSCFFPFFFSFFFNALWRESFLTIDFRHLMVVWVDAGYSFKIIVIKKRLDFLHFPREIFWVKSQFSHKLNLLFQATVNELCTMKFGGHDSEAQSRFSVFTAIQLASSLWLLQLERLPFNFL